MVLYGLDGHVSVASIEAARLLGVADPSDLVGRATLFEFSKSFGLDGSSIGPAIHPGELALRTRQRQRAMVLGIRSEPDNVRWFRVTAEPLFAIGSDVPYAAAMRFEATGH